MFFELVRNNSRRSRKENGLFFVSNIVAIVAFYIVLSLENQDVLVFLKTMESQAIAKLLTLIPVLYVVSLFILFFLVFFAENYQLNRRNHEFGLYLLMGMRRSRLFAMLLMEELWSSLLSILAGIPVAVFLSELISLVTAKLVGLGILGHQFTFSVKAVLGTVAGYCIIRLSVLLLLSRRIVKEEPGNLLADVQKEKQRSINKTAAIVSLLAGITMLAAAYYLAIAGGAWDSLSKMGLTVLLGLTGTFLLFYGIGAFIEIVLKSRHNKGLEIFTFRQLQENVFSRANALAVSSLLVLMALCCFGYGVSVALASAGREQHTLDYTFENNGEDVEEELKRAQVYDCLEELFELRLGSFHSSGGSEEKGFSCEPLIAAVEKQPDSQARNKLVERFGYYTSTYLISLSGYNRILELEGKAPIRLKEDEVALYSDPELAFGETTGILEAALAEGAAVEMGGKRYALAERFYRENIVTDRAITIQYGLIVSDSVLEELTGGQYSSYWNGVIKEELIEESGLMQAISRVNELLQRTTLEYESYLQNMGRHLFYMVAASYTTIYMAVIFIMIANTVIGVQFLIQQEKTEKRYRTLVFLGCGYGQLCRSARKQIRWHFGIPVAVAAVSSIFGVRSLFSGLFVSEMAEQNTTLFIVAATMISVLCVIEFVYMLAVMKMSDRQLKKVMVGRREEE